MTTDEYGVRVHLIPKEQAAPELAPLYEKANVAMTSGDLPGPSLFGNQVRALAHNPPLLQALTQVYRAFADDPSVDRKLVELGVLIVSRVNTCNYCLQHHSPLARRSGLTIEQLRAIQAANWGEQRHLWSNAEWVIIRYAEGLASAAYEISDQLYKQLRELFSDRQIVDLTMRLALCAAWNKFNDALRLDTEIPFQHAFAELQL